MNTLMKLVVLVVLCLVTIACSNTDPLNLAKAGYLCKDEGGVYTLHNLGGVRCNTDKRFSWNTLQNLVLPAEFALKENK